MTNPFEEFLNQSTGLRPEGDVARLVAGLPRAAALLGKYKYPSILMFDHDGDLSGNAYFAIAHVAGLPQIVDEDSLWDRVPEGLSDEDRTRYHQLLCELALLMYKQSILSIAAILVDTTSDDPKSVTRELYKQITDLILEQQGISHKLSWMDSDIE